LGNQTNVELLLGVADPRNLGAWHDNYITAFQPQFRSQNNITSFMFISVCFLIIIILLLYRVSVSVLYSVNARVVVQQQIMYIRSDPNKSLYWVPQNSRNNSMRQCQFMLENNEKNNLKILYLLDLKICGPKRCHFDLIYFK
jgi:hypothetical protein